MVDRDKRSRAFLLAGGSAGLALVCTVFASGAWLGSLASQPAATDASAKPTAANPTPGTTTSPAAEPKQPMNTTKGFVIHTPTTAPAGSQPLLQAIQGANGFVPNIYGVFAESPALLKGYLAADEALGASTLSALERNLVAIVAAEANGSDYCVPGHCTVGKGMGMSDESLAALKTGKPLQDKRLETLRTFTRELIKAKGALTSEQVSAFIAAGFTRANTLDVLAIVGQKTVSAYANNLASVPLDAAFAAQAVPAKK